MDSEIFKRLYDRWFDPIRSYLYYRCGDESLATDICQDVFTLLWRKQIQLAEPQYKPLLYKMAHNRYVDLIRKRDTRRDHLTSLDFRWNDHDPEAQLQLADLKAQYERALSRLPENQRTVFLMSRINGLSYREIAERLGLSVKAIEKRMNKALSTLKIHLYENR
ncbi:MAG: sigma-70 family RNA polymerase sigma factor [Bacteroidota bacterium]